MYQMMAAVSDCFWTQTQVERAPTEAHAFNTKYESTDFDNLHCDTPLGAETGQDTRLRNIKVFEL